MDPLCARPIGAPAIVGGEGPFVNPTTVMPLVAAFDESADPREGLFEAFVRGRVARADVLRARWPERIAGHDGDVLLVQEPP